MRKSLVLLALVAGFSSAVQADESDWTGFYLGANFSQVRGDAQSDAVTSGLWTGDVGAPVVEDGLSASYEPKGNGAGVQLGYDHQFGNGWVLGIEADYQQGGDGASNDTQVVDIGMGVMATLDAHTRADIERAFSIRPKLGYAAGNVLWYVTAGYGWSRAELRSSYEFSVPSLASTFAKTGGESVSSSGLVWGAGMNWRFAEHWDLGLRYTRSQGEDVTYTLLTTSRTGLYTGVFTDEAIETIRHDVEHDTIALTLNYRF